MKKNNPEYLSVVDKNNIVINKATRSDIHHNNLYHRAAHIIISCNNHVFLQLRAKHKDQFPNKWDVSAAGHVLYQESYSNAILRELKEELSLDLSQHVNNIITIDNLPASKDNGFEFLRLYYYNYQDIPNIKLELAEITTGAWFQLEHINHWVTTDPDAFAGGFTHIWQKFTAYISA